MRQHTFRRLSLALLAVGLLWLAACQPTTETEPLIQVSMDKQGDTAEVTLEDDRAIIDVTSPQGIGGMHVSLEEGAWPAEVVVRLHLSGLERLEIGYDQFVIATGLSSNSSPDPALMLYVKNENGEVEESSPSSDVYYPTIEIVTDDGSEGSIPLENGYFQVTMPAHFYQTAPDAFTLQWIDFYR